MLSVDTAAARDFGLHERQDPHTTPWHRHARHQVLHARAGTLHFELEDARWLLPPSRAAFIPAGLAHRTVCHDTVELCTAWLAADRPALSGLPAAVFAVDELAGALLRASAERGPEPEVGAARDPATPHLFALIAALLPRWVASPLPLRLPRPRSPQVERAMTWAMADLAEATLEGAAAAAGCAPRTLSRAIRRETGTTWRAFLAAARVHAAMEALTSTDHSVARIAADVGYATPAAFSTAFSRIAGAPPRAWRRARGAHRVSR